ncbi:restriction endonuclease, partial [Staphylococcus pseudintermedius]
VVPSASILTLNNFEKLGFTTQSEDYFLSNASYIMESLSTTNWAEYLKSDEDLSEEMYDAVIDKNKISD